MKPFFSIVIPTYNRANLIGKTLESVLGQTFADFEVLVIDDGSKDNTDRVVGDFKDPRITYIRKDNGERGLARNFGTDRAKGTYINFFDSDDLMYPNHLDAAKAFIESNQHPAFFHLGYDFKTPDGQVTKKIDQLDDRLPQQVLFDNILSCNGVFLRSDIARAHRFEEDRVMASAEDWELWIRLISRFPLLFSNEITSSVVGHDQRSIFTISADKIIARDLFMIRNLESDREAQKVYGNRFKKFRAQRYSFFMLCLSEQGRYRETRQWGWRALITYPPIGLSKRFLVSMKKIFFK